MPDVLHRLPRDRYQQMYVPRVYRLSDVLPGRRFDRRSRERTINESTTFRGMAGGLRYAPDPRTVSRQIGLADDARCARCRISTATHQGEMRQGLGDLIEAYARRDRGRAR